jgi:indole-3-acetate monooxygenase
MSWANMRFEDFLRTAKDFVQPVIAARGRIERDRALPPDLSHAMREAGFFSLWLPKSLGGPELTPTELTRIVEIFAEADGSAGWLVGIASSSSRLAGYLSEPVRREIWGDGTSVLAGTLNPLGVAVAVPGGYRVSGQWPYASGINHSNWLLGSCRVMDAEVQRMRPDGWPETRLMLFPKDQAEVLDTWDVTGMRGSGSHDFRVTDLYVPAQHSLDAVSPEPVEPGLLYRLPVVTIFNTSVFGVPLGIARAAIDDLTEMAQTKKQFGATQPLREQVPIQTEVGRAEAILRSARAFVLEALEALWKAGEAGEVTTRDRVLARMAGSQAAASAVQVVDMMFAASGAGGIYERGRIGRCWRDVHAMSHHAGLSAFQLQVGGRVMLGLDPGTQRF